MSHTLIATLAGLSTAILWGTSDWLSAKGAKRFRPVEINFGLQVVGTMLALSLLLFIDFKMPDERQLAILATGETLLISAYLIFLRALKDGAIGVVAPIGNSYALVTVALSVLFLSQSFTLQQLSAMVIIVGGAAVLAYEKNTKNIPLRELHKDTLLAVMACVIWGVSFLFMNMVVGEISWQEMLIVTQVFAMGLSIIFLVTTSSGNVIRAAKKGITYKPALVIGLVGTAGAGSIYLGSDYAGSIVIPTVLSACSSLVACMLGAVLDGEKLGILKRIGAVIIVAGVIILNVS